MLACSPRTRRASQRHVLLLQARDLAALLVGPAQQRVALARDHGRVRPADELERGAAGGVVERAHRIGAQQRELVRVRELVPELLQGDRGVRVAGRPQQRDHLAVDTHAATAGPGARELAADGLLEALCVGRSVDHEGLEQLRRIEGDVAAGLDRMLDVDPGGVQRRREHDAMLRGRDDDRRASGVQARADEVADRVGEEPIRLVELDDVLVRVGSSMCRRVYC